MTMTKNRLISIFVFLVISYISNAQVNAGFTDDFSDGNFTSNPTWTGDNGKFIVNSNQQLQLFDTEAGTACLSTESMAIDDACWEFYVKYDFDPSTSNYCDVYLVSNTADVNVCTAGYYVRVCGNSSTDNICLYKKKGNTKTTLVTGGALSFATSGGEMKIKVTRSATGEWSLNTDFGVTGSYSLEGIAVDAEITTSSYFGLYCKYTQTRAQGFYFDNFSVSGTYYVDTEAPILQTARFIQNNKVLLQFNENIDAASLSINNFSVNNGIGNPTSVGIYNENALCVVLEFANAFTSGITYTLEYRGVADVNGNACAQNSTELTFTEFGSGTIVINEIMADPTPIVGLPDSEYIEIYNNSDQAVNLENWTIKIGATAKQLGVYTIYPSEYLILCRDANTSLFADHPNILEITGLSATALTNSGNTITLYNEFMTEVDEITYSSSWYKDASKKDGGWSLERIDPNNRCDQSVNWKASVNENGGTPGTQNSVYGSNIDNVPPTIIGVDIASANELVVTFSEVVDTTSVKTVDNYLLDHEYGNPVYADVDANDNTKVIIMFSAALAENMIYNLSISNIADLCGNIMESSSLAVSTVPTDMNSVIITEIMSKPSPVVALPESKYIEIYNRTSNAINLSGWTITIGNTTKTFPTSSIDAGGYLALCNADNIFMFEGYENILGITGLPAFAQDGVTISLCDKQNKLVHSLTFSSSWHDDHFKANGGYSIELVDVQNPCGGAENWRSTLNVDGGTPGKQNSVFATNPDMTTPYPTAAEIINDTVFVYFSEILLPDYISTSKFSVEEFGHPLSAKILEPQLTTVRLTFDGTYSIGHVYYLNFDDSISDCSGNIIPINSQIRFGIGEAPQANDIVMNELLFNPYSGGSDFVEFYNRSHKVIDLKDLWISNADDNGAVKDSYVITGISRLLLPEEYCAISTDIACQYNFYTILYPENLYQVKNLPSMPDDYGTLILTNRVFDTIDIVSYSKNQHYALLSSKDGVSLERINFDAASSDEGNWYSAAQEAGFATPGYVNSQYAEEIVAESTITLSNDTFSPDNDGYEDQLVIHYNLDKQGYTANMMIYSSNGRFVKYLLNNKMLGMSGNVVWDGFDGNKRLCPAGIYVLYVEMFNTDGDKIVEKHAVVINSRVK